tara:strand:- start:260 stop:361 length:102 start_codon:yes stop_codon:yes gene_type:complete
MNIVVLFSECGLYDAPEECENIRVFIEKLKRGL